MAIYVIDNAIFIIADAISTTEITISIIEIIFPPRFEALLRIVSSFCYFAGLSNK